MFSQPYLMTMSDIFDSALHVTIITWNYSKESKTYIQYFMSQLLCIGPFVIYWKKWTLAFLSLLI